LADTNKLTLENDAARHNQARGQLQAFEQQPDDVKQQQYPTMMTGLQKQGLITPQEYQSWMQGQPTYPGADAMKIHINGLATGEQLNKEEMERRNATSATSRAESAATEAANNTKRTNAELPGLQAKSDIEKASADALRGMTPKDWQDSLDATVSDKTSPLYARTQSNMQLAIRRGDLKGAQAVLKDAGDQLGRVEAAVATAKNTVGTKVYLAGAEAAARGQGQADAAGLTDDDYKYSGEMYGRTGIMPSMGRDSYTRGKIEHAKNEWAKDNGFSPADLVTMQAAYAGDKESLKKFQTQRDQIVSFEQTAQKNLDLMISAGQKLVQTGSPLLNKPLSSLKRNLLGSDDQVAFDAAQLIAQNEVAKVTSGGGLGGVVSDSARHEMQQALGQAPTIGNMLAVAKILKQDMANRHQSMDATLQDIRQRIGGGGAPPPAPQASKGMTFKRTATGPNNHKIGTNDVDASGHPLPNAVWVDVVTGKNI
jgi:hypothetical protein